MSRPKKNATPRDLTLLVDAIRRRQWAVVHGLIADRHPSVAQLRDAAADAGTTAVELEDDWRAWMVERGDRCVVASTVKHVKGSLYLAAHPAGVTA